MAGTKQSHGDNVVKDIRRATRKQYLTEDKVEGGTKSILKVHKRLGRTFDKVGRTRLLSVPNSAIHTGDFSIGNFDARDLMRSEGSRSAA